MLSWTYAGKLRPRFDAPTQKKTSTFLLLGIIPGTTQMHWTLWAAVCTVLILLIVVVFLGVRTANSAPPQKVPKVEIPAPKPVPVTAKPTRPASRPSVTKHVPVTAKPVPVKPVPFTAKPVPVTAKPVAIKPKPRGDVSSGPREIKQTSVVVPDLSKGLVLLGGRTTTYTPAQIVAWKGSCGGTCKNTGDVLSVTMQPGLRKPSSGGMKKLLELSPGVNEILSEFEVRFGEPGKAFDFVKGGKASVLGLEFGKGDASGGEWSNGAASARMMWRRDGAASLYVYYGKNSGTDTSSTADQLPEYSAVHASPSGSGAGHSLWENKRSKTPLPFFKPGVWHRVQIYARMNTSAKHDGVVGMSVDGDTRVYSRMRWLDTPKNVSRLTAVTFFGGSDSTWNPPTQATISFRNIRVTTK